MNAKLIAIIGVLAGCASDPTGEPNLGDATFNYEDHSARLVVGSAIEAPDDRATMIVQLGTDTVDCDVDLDRAPSMPDGYFVSFTLPKAGVVHAPIIIARRGDGRDSWRTFAPGIVGIDSVGERVTGTVSFSTVHFELGDIEVLGRFDVKRCF